MSDRQDKLVVCLNDLEVESIDWLWPGWLAAGKITLIDGDPSQGKSFMTFDLAARLSTAQALPDGYVPAGPCSVVLVGSEDGLRDTVLPRLRAANADLRRVHAFAGRARDGPWRGLPTFPEDCDLLRDTARETAARLIVIDPLMAFLSDRACSLNDQMVRRALGPMARAAEETRAALVLVRHLNKGRSQRALYRGSGSIAIIGSARTAFLVGRHPEDDELRVVACTKNNMDTPAPSLGFRIGCNAQEQPVLTWTGPVDVAADDLVLAPRAPHGEMLQHAKDVLQELLRAGPCSCEEVHRKAQEAGISARTLKRAKGQLGVLSEERRDAHGNCWYWSLPAAEEPTETWAERHARELEQAQKESDRFFEEFRERHAKLKAQRSGANSDAPSAPDH
jgi:hypothetical protein